MTSPLMEYFNYIYIKPYTRLSPYLIGVTLGYIINKERKKEINFPQNHKLVKLIFPGISMRHLHVTNDFVLSVPLETVFLGWLQKGCISRVTFRGPSHPYFLKKKFMFLNYLQLLFFCNNWQFQIEHATAIWGFLDFL